LDTRPDQAERRRRGLRHAHPTGSPAGKSWAYNHPFFIPLNFAVGGKWPGNPDDTTRFPQQVLVDYVRVYHL
jgi:beta-glucanase (GH16 family)